MATMTRETRYRLDLDEVEYQLTRRAWTLLWERERSPQVAALLGLPPDAPIAQALSGAAAAAADLAGIEAEAPSAGPLPTPPIDIMDERRAEAARIAAMWGDK